MADYKPDLLNVCPNPKKPDYKAPADAVDAHCHVFGPAARFPFAPESRYRPNDAPKEKLFALRDYLGFAKNVIVQASCHGTDNSAMIDALQNSNGKAKGIAVVAPGVSYKELQEMHAAGNLGVRFNFVRRLVDWTPPEQLKPVVEKIVPLGWHIVVYFEPQDLPGLESFISALPTKVVIDHMGRPDVSKGVDHPDFQHFIRFMEANTHVWVKVSCPERLTMAKQPPFTYDDVVPFQRTLVEKFPDRVLWGTDWPHPNMTTHMPDDGALVDVIPRIATTPKLQQALLVDNPNRLYWS